MQYIHLRNKTYHFRFVIPKRFRHLYPHREIKRSLRTDSYSAAVAQIASQFPLIQQIVQFIEPNSHVVTLLNNLSSFISQPLNHADYSVPKATYKPGLVQINSISSAGGYLLNDAWKEFVQWKSWNEKVEKGAMRYFEFIQACFGNVPVDSITKKDIKSLLTRYALTPKRNIKPYHLMTPQELLNLNDVEPGNLISSKTVKELFKLCQSFFSRFLTKEKDVLAESPTNNVKCEANSTRYAVFSDSEIRDIESSCKKLDDWKKWVVLIAIYSGARRSEIAALKKVDVRFDVDSQRHYFWIAQGKTKAAVRRIPIHHNLIDSGFLDYVSSVGNDLFPEVVDRSYNITEHLHNKLSFLGINQQNDLGERKVFHSFRHTFITKSRSQGIELGLLQEVVGHEKFESGITKRYTHSYPLKKILAVVDSVYYYKVS
ncbi:tyrosine-type recombinase/integrase [Shewanella frigidimarina]|uniref:tyrosine-type recombinase/integrase n=1 Tax=Shewanella frigidimarina TaxID=56812 RepID=UPI003D79CB69